MAFINIEIKARTSKADVIRQYLIDHAAELRGIDEQTDTYFNATHGRLKLREGKIENSLIYYHRKEIGGPKQSDVELIKTDDGPALKSVLEKALGIKTIVKKRREIYYIGNVKFHLDTLDALGSFVEIEASNQFDPLPEQRLRDQCREYMQAFGISDEDIVNGSYSDMIADVTID
ncbi:MAG: class IV adenylate cyclase [Chitinophagaceae bacterium]